MVEHLFGRSTSLVRGPAEPLVPETKGFLGLEVWIEQPLHMGGWMENTQRLPAPTWHVDGPPNAARCGTPKHSPNRARSARARMRSVPADGVRTPGQLQCFSCEAEVFPLYTFIFMSRSGV